jgi:ribosomal protein L11 methyltransferase
LSALGERFPLVLANLTAAELEPLAGQLAARLTPGGELVASGILAEQEERMRAVNTAAGLKIEACRQEGEWVAVVCRWPEEGP